MKEHAFGATLLNVPDDRGQMFSRKLLLTCVLIKSAFEKSSYEAVLCSVVCHVGNAKQYFAPK